MSFGHLGVLTSIIQTSKTLARCVSGCELLEVLTDNKTLIVQETLQEMLMPVWYSPQIFEISRISYEQSDKGSEVEATSRS